MATLISDKYEAYKAEVNERWDRLKANEEELNRIFAEIYDMVGEVPIEVEDKYVSVARVFDTAEEIPESFKGNRYVLTRRDVIVSLISYAVDCMFGRYSLDVDGLVLADAKSTLSDYLAKMPDPGNVTFMPDANGIIPICDEDFFADDITGYFRTFVKAAYGDETLEESLRYVADALDPKSKLSPLETVRQYFLKSFFTDHCKTYKKCPIYWLFDSGKKNGFKALVYLHRYTPDTLAQMRTDYVHVQQERYRNQLEQVRKDAEEATGGAAARYDKLDEISRDTYTLMYDMRLAKGIPQFFNLMGRLIWDMRACSKSLADKPFTVNFVGVRNVDADVLYGDEPVRSVPGAQRARKSLVVKSAPEITLPEVAKAAPTKEPKAKSAKVKTDTAEAAPAKTTKAKSASSKTTKSKSAKNKSAADEAGSTKPAASKTKKTAPAKPKKPALTLEQMLDQMHDRVEADIEHGAPAVNPATTMRAVRTAMYSAGGNGSMFDDTIAELDRQFRAGEIPPRTLGEDDLADDKPLGRVVNMLRTSGGGLAKETVISRLGEEALSAACSDPAVVEHNGKLYLWCHRDEAGKPMRDHKQAILTLEKREKKAEEAYAAGKPFSEERLREVNVERTKAILALNNAGFFAFSKKKELKARIAALEDEHAVLEKSRAAMAQIDDARKELAQAKENAENEYKQRGLL